VYHCTSPSSPQDLSRGERESEPTIPRKKSKAAFHSDGLATTGCGEGNASGQIANVGSGAGDKSSKKRPRESQSTE